VELVAEPANFEGVEHADLWRSIARHLDGGRRVHAFWVQVPVDATNPLGPSTVMPPRTSWLTKRGNDNADELATRGKKATTKDVPFMLGTDPDEPQAVCLAYRADHLDQQLRIVSPVGVVTTASTVTLSTPYGVDGTSACSVYIGCFNSEKVMAYTGGTMARHADHARPVVRLQRGRRDGRGAHRRARAFRVIPPAPRVERSSPLV
jgi:hypothetical protein